MAQTRSPTNPGMLGQSGELEIEKEKQSVLLLKQEVDAARDAEKKKLANNAEQTSQMKDMLQELQLEQERLKLELEKERVKSQTEFQNTVVKLLRSDERIEIRRPVKHGSGSVNRRSGKRRGSDDGKVSDKEKGVGTREGKVGKGG